MLVKNRSIFIKNSLIIFLAAALITARYATTRPKFKNGDNVKITANVLSDPLIFPGSQMVKISGLIMYLPKFPVVHYGDEVVIEGTVDGVKLENPRLLHIKSGNNFLFDLRQRILNFYQRNLPEPEAGLIAGIILGSKASLDRDFYNNTKKTGVAHIVVASGTNIAFLTGFLISLLALFVKRKEMIFIVILNIILYILLSGLEAPLIRAGIMSSVTLLGQYYGRTVSLPKLFLFCLFIMLFYKPEYTKDIGFLLSFAVTGSIMYFEPKLKEKLKFLPKVIKESASVSLAAWLGATPILLFALGTVNFLSPLTNLLIGFCVPAIMVLGSLAVFISFLSEPAGIAVLYLSYPFLWWFSNVVEFFA